MSREKLFPLFSRSHFSVHAAFAAFWKRRFNRTLFLLLDVKKHFTLCPKGPNHILSKQIYTGNATEDPLALIRNKLIM